MKILKTKEGKEIKRVSRWIKVRNNYNPSRRNRLWPYVTDGAGYHEGDKNYNPADGLFLDYFVWNGRTWAIEEFLCFGSMICPETISWEEDGKLHWMSGFDGENYFNPIMIESDEYGEYVRVYEEV